MHISRKHNGWGKFTGKLKCEMCGKMTKCLSFNQKFCPKCGAINKKNLSCAWEERRKQERIEAKANEKPPKFYCECGHLIQLDFKPLEDKIKWREFKCPQCDKKIVGN